MNCLISQGCQSGSIGQGGPGGPGGPGGLGDPVGPGGPSGPGGQAGQNGQVVRIDRWLGGFLRGGPTSISTSATWKSSIGYLKQPE